VQNIFDKPKVPVTGNCVREALKDFVKSPIGSRKESDKTMVSIFTRITVRKI
jgi:hypothetical protein